MKTILFHSHRGGTGRSLCLSNCAAYLAMQGKKVLALDLDIDAGGLSIIFKGIPESLDKEKPRGLVRILIEELRENITEEIEKFDNFIISEKYPLDGQLHFIFMDPQPFWTGLVQNKSQADVGFIRQILSIKQNILAENYTHFLVDLPAGLNPIREAYIQISDTAIVLSRPNQQGAFGTRLNLDNLHSIGLKTYFILSNVPAPQNKKSKDKISKFLSEAGIAKGECYAIIPYDAKLAFGEELTVLTRPKADISKIYIEIAKSIEG